MLSEKMEAKPTPGSIWQSLLSVFRRRKQAETPVRKTLERHPARVATTMPAANPRTIPIQRPVSSALNRSTWQQSGQKLEQRHPHLWKLTYPRVYQSAGRYHSPRQLAADLTALLVAHERGANFSPMLRDALVSAAKLVALQVPTFFVSPELLLAVRQTKPPLEIRWCEMKLPFDSAAFMLPTGSLKHPKDGEIAYLWYSRWRKSETITIPGNRPQKAAIGDDIFCVQAATTACGFQQTIAGRKTPVLNLRDVEGLITDTPKEGSEALLPEDFDLISSMVNLIFGLLYVMLSRPELVEKGQSTGAKTKLGLEIWRPNILGERYRIMRDITGVRGTSPRMHWRRGHWRNQAFGPEHRFRKELWIEPVLVAGD